MDAKPLTEPQILLLLKLHEKPAAISPRYRPLEVLIERQLVRPRMLGRFGANATYECTDTGNKQAQEIKQRLADQNKACTCGRNWSLKHDLTCPLAGPL